MQEFSPIIDTKLIDKPSKCPEGKDKWPEWRFKFENYMACLEPKYTKELDEAAVSTGPITIREGIDTGLATELAKRNTTLFAILSMLLQGKDFALAKKLKATKNGWMLPNSLDLLAFVC